MFTNIGDATVALQAADKEYDRLKGWKAELGTKTSPQILARLRAVTKLRINLEALCQAFTLQ